MRFSRLQFIGLFALVLTPVTAKSGTLGETSCDVITGASCFIEEGCDCDHDGYVRKKGKSAQYCHYERCPIDGDDDNPNVLGVPSENNLDGDGWTNIFDCDDENPCIGNSCEPIKDCSPDMDGDGFAQGDDCDDTNGNVFPEASIACCSCEVLSETESRAEFQCDENPCPSDRQTYSDAGNSPQGRLGNPYADATASPPRWSAHMDEDAVLGGGLVGAEEDNTWACNANPKSSKNSQLWWLCFALALWTLSNRKKVRG